MNTTFQRKRSIKANDVIHDQFIILGKLDNQKHSSKLFKGFDRISKNFVVVKITSAAYKEKNKNVTKILQKLTESPEFRESKGSTGVPTIVWRGEILADTITVTECLGPNLKKLFLLMDKNFSIPTISMIAMQVLNTLEYIHSYHYVCCNVMPKEILISLHRKSLTLFITDYKQARKVKSGRQTSSETTAPANNKSILNKFSSVNLHLGLPASKIDDLESLAYILVYFFRHGHLFDKKAKTFTKEEKIKFYEQQKLTLSPETFCNGLPQEMTSFMSHVKAMQTSQANDNIDYDYLRKLFKNLFNKHSTMDTFQYDWISKARMYNLDSGKKSGEEKMGLENSFKSEQISIQSPMERGSDVLTELDDQKGSFGSNPIKKFQNMKSDDFDPYGMEEFAEDNQEGSPGQTQRVNEIVSFQYKVQTFEDLKVRNVQAVTEDNVLPTTKGKNLENNNNVGGSLATASTFTTSKPSNNKIEKQPTLTSDKISSFGKIYQREKSMKTK